MNVLVVDVGGSHVKVTIAGRGDTRRFDSSASLAPGEMVERVGHLTAGWPFDVVSIGYPGRVGPDGPEAEPGNLGDGWVNFDFAGAFGKPTRVQNDAVLQALGAYDGGRMLFLGLGTGLGSTLVAERVIVPLELGDLPHSSGGTLGERLGKAGLVASGDEEWNREIAEAIRALQPAFLADYVVLGGGNCARVDPLPPGARRGGNDDAVTGGQRLWAEIVEPHDRKPPSWWRVVP